jgi:hypothetical protein
MTRHLHADCIIAWANEETIQLETTEGVWSVMSNPQWDPNCKYRVQPKEPNYAQIAFDTYMRDNINASGKLWQKVAESVINAYKEYTKNNS